MSAYFWLALSGVALAAKLYVDYRHVMRDTRNFRAVEQERIARKATAPLGNAERFWS